MDFGKGAGPKTATLWPIDGMIALRFRFDKNLIDDLKLLVPGTHRKWCPDTTDKFKSHWRFEAGFLDAVTNLLERHGFEVSILGAGNTSAAPVVIEVPEIKQACYMLLKHANPEDRKKLYRAVMMAVHPDRGGDPEAAKEVNTAWAVIDAELG